MKLLLILLMTSFCIWQGYSKAYAQTTAPATSKNQTATHFGRAVSAGKSMAASELPRFIAGKDSVQVKVSGVVQQVCQVKGCWMDVKLTDNTHMKVRFRNYGFFVPKNLNGKKVVLEGTAYQEVISVADQQHYLKDAGKSTAEIQAIVQPKKEITFVADGVQLL